MTNTLLEQALQLLLAGMGTVFVFLTLLVAATGLLSRLVGRFEPRIELPDADAPSAAQVAAITAAIHQYRANR